MGLSKSKRKPNYKFGGNSNKHIYYTHFSESGGSTNFDFLLRDENGDFKKVTISANELIMKKCINPEKLTALIDKKLK